MDALGSNIRVDTKGREVMRFLPRNHDGVNEEWLADKSRFVWDGLRRQRLDQPYIREAGKLQPTTWANALEKAALAMTNKKVSGLVGDLVPVEAAFALRQLVVGLGGSVECRTDGAKLPAGNRSAYVGTAAIEDIDNAKTIQLIGTDPRVEAPVLNARIRKAWGKGANIGVLGKKIDLTYDYVYMGDSHADLIDLLKNKSTDLMNGPSIVIVGQAALQGVDGSSVLAAVMDLCTKTDSKLMILHTAASRVGAMDVGCTTEGGLKKIFETSEVVYNLGADEINIEPGPFVIYQGSHGDRGAHRADIILPGAAYTEENGLFVNTEGRPQLAQRAGFAPGSAKENWAILRALSAELNTTLSYDTLAQLRKVLVAEFPHLSMIDQVPNNDWSIEVSDKLGKGVFDVAVSDYYLSNPIARASILMAELSSNAKARIAAPLAAE
jgi:NADH-quinone oxidoreductase subunit G